MDDEFDYEPMPTWRERMAEMYCRWLPYALGIIVLCAFLFFACTVAARIDDPHGSSQWDAALDVALRKLKNPPDGQ